MPNFKLNQSIHNVLDKAKANNSITQTQRNFIISKVTTINIPSAGARNFYLAKLNAIPIVG